MKLIAILGLFISINASANNTICSGEKTFYRFIQSDSGASTGMRNPAHWSLYAELEDGKTINYSVNDDAMPTYTVNFSNRRTLANLGNHFSSDSIYEATMTVTNSKGVNLIEDTVTCRHTQLMLP